MRSIFTSCCACLVWTVLSASAAAQERVTADDYAHAQRFLSSATTPLVLHAADTPTWMPDGRLWYRTITEDGAVLMLVDPGSRSARRVFEPSQLLRILSSRMGGLVNSGSTQLALSSDGRTFTLTVGEKRWTCDVPLTDCTASQPDRARGNPPEVLSPDRRRAVFIRANNLWLRDVASGSETQLTTDGVKDFGYATDNAGWTRSDRPVVAWSPDSTRIATFQQDERRVGEMYLVDTRVGHPNLSAWKYPFAGDDVLPEIHRVVIDLRGAPHVVPLQVPPDLHRSTACDDLQCRGEWGDVQWAPDSESLAFVSTSRDHKRAQLRIADPSTGRARDVFAEESATYFESGNGYVNWRYLAELNEVVWFSERDGWSQLYLYDLKTAAVKNRITTGSWNVTRVLRADARTRQVYFLGVGREEGRDPYFAHVYRVRLDGTQLELVTPEAANHDVSMDAWGRYFIDRYSTPDTPPVSVMRKVGDPAWVLPLERADISRLTTQGWKPPIAITVKARDGVTDLYGLMYRPTRFDEAARYPVVVHVYPGPQTGSVGSRNFIASRGDSQALAELGFVVIEVDGLGTPGRSKAFHDASYGDLSDNTVPDQVAAVKQLGSRFPQLDLERVGVWGHSGGGYATVTALLRYPEFFKVGIAESGNYDNRLYEDDWAEKWHGLLQPGGEGKSNYDGQAIQNLAGQLQGHLLLAHGTMDANVPPTNTLVLVDALIKANKDFDLLMLPNQAHGYGSAANYMTRRRWDYFVRYLKGAEPPREYRLN